MRESAWRLVGACLLAGAVIAASTAALAEPESFVRVKVETANVRGGPSTRAALLRQAYENDPLRVVERRGAWLRVVDFTGQPGWIHTSLTDPARAVMVARRSVNVRSGPGTRYEIRFSAEHGVGFRVIDVRGEWLHVEHADGDRGWIYRPLVWGAVEDAGE
jgi:SH3-like domain-containing protein